MICLLNMEEVHRRRPMRSRSPGHRQKQRSQAPGGKCRRGVMGARRAPRDRRTVLDADSLTGPHPPTRATESRPDEARHRTNHRRSVTMPIKLSYITPLLAAAAAAVIATAPTAAADTVSTQPTAIATTPAAVDSTSPFCASLGGSATLCQTPGNAQINDAPPTVR